MIIPYKRSFLEIFLEMSVTLDSNHFIMYKYFSQRKLMKGIKEARRITIIRWDSLGGKISIHKDLKVRTVDAILL